MVENHCLFGPINLEVTHKELYTAWEASNIDIIPDYTNSLVSFIKSPF